MIIYQPAEGEPDPNSQTFSSGLQPHKNLLHLAGFHSGGKSLTGRYPKHWQTR